VKSPVVYFSPGSLPSITSPRIRCGMMLVGLVVLVGRFLAGTGDDERRARFVDQDGIHFVDDGEVVPRCTQFSMLNFMLSRR
jgi:hypothetical protein